MATLLRRTVVRKCAREFGPRRRHLMVRLEPGDIITMWEERTRRRYSLPLDRVYLSAVRAHVEGERRTKQEARWRKSRGGQ